MRLKLSYCLNLLIFTTFVAASLQAQPQISGSDLVCNGESFFAASNICSELTRLARADGVLPQGESFKQVAVSGAPLSSIINQYKGCNPKPTYLVSDGAGIDLMSSGDMTSLGNQLKQYLEEMRNNGTKKLLWMIYPDPQGGSWATLKNNQDKWAEEVPKIMAEVTEPEVYLVDLRDTWAGHYSEYTSDGIHCTNAGGTATAEAFWEAMKANDYAFFNLSSTPQDTTPPEDTTTVTVQTGEVPRIEGTDLVINGESFFAAANTRDELSRLAREDGVLAAGDKFGQVAVSGAPLSSIINQYKGCNPKPTYLVSDGAGIDLMSSGDMTSLGNQLKQYLEEMRNSGTKKLLWMIYPDPQGGSWATLKNNQDKWAEEVPKIMAEVEEPEVYIVDLRETWEGHYNEYTSDGIHQTNAGGTATAEAFWEVMKADNYAFFDTVPPVATIHESSDIAKTVPFTTISKVVENSNIVVALSVDQPSDITLQLITVSGRSVLMTRRHTTGSGLQTVRFPLGTIASGIYCCKVTSGKAVSQSTLLIP